ncbi:aldehyde dehydrogenase (NADP(+)) [Nocardiopsis halotolerans]|uniref:aldehyde dehydrogenase (NADP(+)) n=1 Tax=Nocardiopsis halotolerans TaxID=124252 RepID=UPI0003499211|nr:aldehyde dehydrogenase (NADP(+)) [Nocardiopsis halotolerans]
MTDIISFDPRTGSAVETVASETTPEELERICSAAAEAAEPLQAMGRARRARLLRAMADGLEADREAIVATADRESALGEQRLNGELTRTCYQFRQFADAVEEGSFVEATIDHAGDTPMGPRPDLRRMLVPLGPVAVFGASNFPLAFSVPGGDTAAALAAGCPVVVKAHPAHPATSLRCFDVLVRAAADGGAPEGVLALVHGTRAGADLVRHPAIRAVGFTGSERGGRALFDIASSRPDPVPFYGELGSVNPLVVTPEAARRRGEEIARGVVGSFTLGAGQFCTKPGLVFLPADDAGRKLEELMIGEVTEVPPFVLLTEGIRDAYEAAGTEGLAAQGREASEGWGARARLIATDAADLTEDAVQECFGPVTTVVRYRDESDLRAALERVPASLTATLLSERDEADLRGRVGRALREKAGRLVYDAYPTGVAVTWAMHHGGPWPASTNALHTSVGATSLRRFLRPVAWQGAAPEDLPDELADTPENPLPRRVDGRLEV